MLSLRIGLDVLRQNSDLDARMLKDAPPDLAAIGRRLVAVAAAALPAMVAAASAVAQPELSGCRQAVPSSSPSPFRSVAGDFRPAAVTSPLSSEHSGEMTSNELGSSCVRGGDGRSPRRSPIGADDVGGIDVTSSGRGSSVTTWVGLVGRRLDEGPVRRWHRQWTPDTCRRRQWYWRAVGPVQLTMPMKIDDADEEGALGVCRRSVIGSSTLLKVKSSFDDCDTWTTCDCSCCVKQLGLAATFGSVTSSHDADVLYAVRRNITGHRSSTARLMTLAHSN